jgi:amino acid transporter
VLTFRHVFSAAFGLVVCSTTLMLVCYGYASEAGVAFIVSQLIALVILILTALSMSELATTWPKAGSFGVYVREALGREAGMLVALLYFMMFFPLSAEAILIGKIAELYIPQIPWQGWSVFYATIMLIVNLLGILLVGRVALAMTIYMIGTMVLFSLLYIAGLGVTSFNWESATALPAEWGQLWVPVVTWAMLAFWLYVGFEVPAPLAEETKEPEKTIPRATVCALLFIFAVQALFGFAVRGALTPEEILSVPYPHVEAGLRMFGPTAMAILATVSIVATLSTFNTVMAGSSRLLWSLGHEGYLPKVGWLHPRFRTPWIPLFIEYVVIVLFILFLEKYIMLMIAVDTFIFLLIYLLLHVSVIVLRNKQPSVKRPFSVGGPWKMPIVPILGIVGMLVTMYYQFFGPMGDPTALWAGGTAALAALVFSVIVLRTYAKARK